MHCELTVHSSSRSYGIFIGAGTSRDAVDSADVVVVDSALSDFLPRVDGSAIKVVASEASKTLLGVEALALQLRDKGINRRSTMCVIGGGSIQDVATLTAALYMRGIQWTYVPTTLMAMADSCIGGKSAINAGGYKNLLGNFNPPSRIFVDPELATTQPEAARLAGVAEAVKICYVSSPADFAAFVKAVDVTRRLDLHTIEALVTLALVAKKRIVELDEFDTGERQLLNFGHTFGHALEAASGMTLPHGLGVAIGMRAALNHPSAGSTDQTQELDRFSAQLLSRARSAGWAVPRIDWDSFARAFQSDKKHVTSQYRMVLPDVDGRPRLVSLARTDDNLRACLAAAAKAVEGSR